MPSHRSAPPTAVPAPIRSDAAAVALLRVAAVTPLEPEVLCFLLDAGGRGSVVLTVSGTHDPNAVLDVVDLVGRAALGTSACYLVVASVRPDGLVEPDDDWRLDELDQITLGHDLELLEWYVIGPDEPVRMVECVGQRDSGIDRWSVPWVDVG